MKKHLLAMMVTAISAGGMMTSALRIRRPFLVALLILLAGLLMPPVLFLLTPLIKRSP